MYMTYMYMTRLYQGAVFNFYGSLVCTVIIVLLIYMTVCTSTKCQRGHRTAHLHCTSLVLLCTSVSAPALCACVFFSRQRRNYLFALHVQVCKCTAKQQLPNASAISDGHRCASTSGYEKQRIFLIRPARYYTFSSGERRKVEGKGPSCGRSS